MEDFKQGLILCYVVCMPPCKDVSRHMTDHISWPNVTSWSAIYVYHLLSRCVIQSIFKNESLTLLLTNRQTDGHGCQRVWSTKGHALLQSPISLLVEFR